MELFITLTILAITAGLLGWHFKGAFDHHRFQNSVDLFTIHIKQLQTQSLSYQADVEIVLSQDKDGVVYRCSTDDRLKGFNTKKVALPGISSFTYEGRRVAALKLRLFSSGRIDPPGVLTFYHEDQRRWLDLRTPLQIAASDKAPKQKLDPIPLRRGDK